MTVELGSASSKTGRITLTIGYLLAIYVSVPFSGELLQSLFQNNLMGTFVTTVLGLSAAVALWLVMVVKRIRAIAAYGLLAVLALATLYVMSRLEVRQERVHFVQYATLAMAILWCLEGPGFGRRSWFLAVALSSVAGLLDEGIQGLVPKRYFDLHDVWLNGVASVAGAGFYAIVRSYAVQPTAADRENASAASVPWGQADSVPIQSTVFGQRTVGLPPAPRGPFCMVFASPPTEIAATNAQVWAVLRDFGGYPDWNPLNRFVRPATKVELGTKLLLGISWGPYYTETGPVDVQNLQLSLTNTEVLSVDQAPLALGWADSWNRWIHRAERVQYLTALPNGHTLYRSEEVMVGLLSPLIGWLYRDRILGGFAAAADALKRRVEAGQVPKGLAKGTTNG